jgi:phosphoglycolate phosphatase
MAGTRAVLFDLDGTFADTAPDLGFALNTQLRLRGRDPLPIEKIRRIASSGARGLLGLGFGLRPGDADYDAMNAELLNLYEANLCRETRLFPGIQELLDIIRSKQMHWGIVTNKATRFTLPLMRLLGFGDDVGCIICGDSAAHRKPHPAPLLMASAALAVDPAACIYLGDDERDMIAGRSAGMRVAVAEYGYLGVGTPCEEWEADLRIAHPIDLVAML